MITKYTVPGWIKDKECDLITELVSSLPDNAKILEIGTAFGKSTLSILDGMKPGQRLDVCDLWDPGHWHDMVTNGEAESTVFGDKEIIKAAVENIRKHGIRNTWEGHVMPHQNSNLIRTIFQQRSATLIDIDYDLVFLDGDHTYDNLSLELEKFKNVPILCGDDFGYHVGHEGVIKAVVDFGAYRQKVLTVDLEAFFFVLRNRI